MGRRATFMPGRCVIILQSENGTPFINLSPFYGLNFWKAGQYFYGYAGFGAAADFYGNNVVAVGSPGLTIFEGAVTIMDFRSGRRNFSCTRLGFENTLNKTAYGYLGYEVKFGRFCNPPTICLAAGAPNLYTVGVIRLYQWVDEVYLSNFQSIKGEKSWSYFGSVLCAADIDGDGLDELLVGAPYYSDAAKKEDDIGKVYVYKRKRLSKYFNFLQKLDGGKTKYSRFGSAIQMIGDINKDQYSDIAIGAPGEDNGVGCLYVFLGSPTGLGKSYSQKICHRHVPALVDPVVGFGSSISGPSYTRKSSYPVIAVGAFQSDAVVIFQSKTILEVKISVTTTPSTIDINKICEFHQMGPCTRLFLCLHHSVREQANTHDLQDNLYFQISMTVDRQTTSGGSKSALFMNQNGTILVGNVVITELIPKEGKCLNDYIIIFDNSELKKDAFTPAQLEVAIEFDPTKMNDNTLLLDPMAQKPLYHAIMLENDCGSDNLCQVDLAVHSQLVHPSWKTGNTPYIIFGLTKEMSLLVTVSNFRESCYWTEISVRLSQPLVLAKFYSDRIRQCKMVDDYSNSVGTSIVCTFNQPLVTDASISVLLTFDTENLLEDKKSVIISTDVKARDKIHNPETNPSDNYKQLKALVLIVADINIYGVAGPKELTITKAKKNFKDDAHHTKGETISFGKEPKNFIKLNHKLLIKNKGPSFLPITKVYLYIPVYIPDGTKLVTNSVVKLITSDQVTDCSKPSQIPKISDDILSTTTGPLQSATQMNMSVTTTEENVIFQMGNSTSQQWTYSLTCDTTPELCATFECAITKALWPGGHAELNVTLTLDKDNIPLPEDFTTFKLELKTVVQQPTHKLFKSWNTTNSQQATALTNTVFNLYQSGGRISLWIIIGSVFAGIVLIAVIVVIFWKLGFFERERHFQVKKLRSESIKP